MEGEMDVYVERREVCRWIDGVCMCVACAETDVSVCAQAEIDVCVCMCGRRCICERLGSEYG